MTQTLPVKNISTTKFYIDVNQSTVPGVLCFLPEVYDLHGDEGVLKQVSYLGERPPVAEYEIIGYIYEGPQNYYDKWMIENHEVLAKLNIRHNRG